jgi:O-antigen/teichoic acid export membrane protein
MVSPSNRAAGPSNAPQRNLEIVGRNTALNFFGQATAAVAAVICIPLTVRYCGANAYGLLALATVAFGISGLFELGLGRATTNAVADYLSLGRGASVGAVVWTSLVLQMLLGVLGGLAIIASRNLIVYKLLQVPAPLVPEAIDTFTILAIALPIVLGSSALRGALEGAQRFDLVNSVKVPLNISTYLIPLLAALAGLRVHQIVLLLAIARVVATVAYLLLCSSALPSVRADVTFKRTEALHLAGYAGWVTVSNVTMPVLTQLDRYLIASLVGVGLVTFYSVPFEILNGLLIIPGSLALTLFPAFSGLTRAESDHQLTDLYARPIKYIVLLLGLAALTLIAFARPLLSLWQGPAFAQQSTTVLKILSMGALINAIGWIPSNLIMGLRRPDLTAKIHLVQVPIYLVLVYVLVTRLGIVGAAVSFTLRVSLETLLLFSASFHLSPASFRALVGHHPLRAVGIVILFGLALLGLWTLNVGDMTRFGVTCLLILSCAGAVWLRAFDNVDRSFFRAVMFLPRSTR